MKNRFVCLLGLSIGIYTLLLVPASAATYSVPVTPLTLTTTWIGNTLNPGGDFFTTGVRRFMMQYFGAPAVSPDGYVFCNTTWEEGGNSAAIYKDANWVADSPSLGNGVEAVAVSSKHVVYAKDGGGVVIFDRTPGFAINGTPGGANAAHSIATDSQTPTSLAIDESRGRFYMADATGRIRAFEFATSKELDIQFKAPPRPGCLAVDNRGNLWVMQRAQLADFTMVPGTSFGSKAAPGHGIDQLNTNESSYFQMADPGGYAGVDLGKSTRITRVFLWSGSGDWKGSKIQGSDSQSGPWTDLMTITDPGPGWPGRMATIDDPAPHRYVRVLAAHDKAIGIIQIRPYTTTDTVGGRVVCLSPQGELLPAVIDDVAVPAAISYDAGHDRLLIADNGPNQQVVAYTNLAGTPAIDTSFAVNGRFGVQGGVLAGPAAARGAVGPGRISNMRGLGVDAAGNLYIGTVGASGLSQTHLECYGPDGVRKWKTDALANLEAAQLDPRTDNVLYNSVNRFAMDFTKLPGNQATLVASTVDPVRYPQDPRIAGFAAMIDSMKIINGQPFLFDTDQGRGHYAVYRFSPATNGYTAIPCGMIMSFQTAKTFPPHQPVSFGSWIWRDKNGDGLFDADEYETVGYDDNMYYHQSWIDPSGNIWYWNQERNSIRELVVSPTLDSHGAPQWSFASSSNRKWTVPAPFQPDKDAWICRVMFDSRSGLVYIFGFTKDYKSTLGTNVPAGRLLVRYKISGNTLVEYDRMVLPYGENVAGQDKDLAYETVICGDYLFVGYYMKQSNRVYRLSDLAYVGSTFVGKQATNPIYDGSPELIVCKRRSDPSYELFQPGYTNCAVNMLTWNPLVQLPFGAPDGLKAAKVGPTAVTLTWSQGQGATGYQVDRMILTPGGWTPWAKVGEGLTGDNPMCVDSNLRAGHSYAYRVRSTADGGSSDYSATVYVTTSAK